jgi:hypothetical protein
MEKVLLFAIKECIILANGTSKMKGEYFYAFSSLDVQTSKIMDTHKYCLDIYVII